MKINDLNIQAKLDHIQRYGQTEYAENSLRKLFAFPEFHEPEREREYQDRKSKDITWIGKRTKDKIEKENGYQVSRCVNKQLKNTIENCHRYQINQTKVEEYIRTVKPNLGILSSGDIFWKYLKEIRGKI